MPTAVNGWVRADHAAVQIFDLRLVATSDAASARARATPAGRSTPGADPKTLRFSCDIVGFRLAYARSYGSTHTQTTHAHGIHQSSQSAKGGGATINSNATDGLRAAAVVLLAPLLVANLLQWPPHAPARASLAASQPSLPSMRPSACPHRARRRGESCPPRRPQPSPKVRAAQAAAARLALARP